MPNQSKITTSVVIPTYNGKNFLQANLPAVFALKAQEVIIIDDASSDDIESFLKDYPSVKLIKHRKNLRFPRSTNEGVARATGDIIILLNQDVKPHPDLLKHTLPHFLPLQVFAVTFNEGQRSWADGVWKNGFLEFTNGKMDNKIHHSLWPSGGSAAFRKRYWDQLGGFDPIFTPGYFEDLDLGLRAQKAGYQIIWDPQCRVDHLTEATFTTTFSPRHLRYIKERNYLIACWKNMPPNLWPNHIFALTKRIISHPGYLIPFLWALWTKLVS